MHPQAETKQPARYCTTPHELPCYTLKGANAIMTTPHKELSNNIEARQYSYNDSHRCNQPHQSMNRGSSQVG